MLDEQEFRNLMQRVRSGDGDAATELVRLYEPEIRRAIRIRLTDNRLRRMVDSVDIWQSIIGNFFVRAAAGQFELDNPTALLKLLKRMAQNKLIDKSRKPEPECHDPKPLAEVPQGGETPSQIVANEELVAKALAMLPDDIKFLRDQRLKGREWADIGAELNDSPEALRKKLDRAMDKVAKQLGLDPL
jgi:RNA polymerase sigma-70 factor (ECF subfamily)